MSDEVNEIQEIQSGIVKNLQDDIEFCAPFIETDQKGAQNQQFWRRTYIRTFMARVEGTSNAFKDVALRIARIMQTTLTPAELALLKDEHYQLNDKGQA